MNHWINRRGHLVPLACQECDAPESPASLPVINDSQLAVLFRQVQWALDEAAHQFPEGRVTPERREDLLGQLELLTRHLRASLQKPIT